jgi:hypothetical protein
MLKFEAMKSLFGFFNVPMNPKNHWNDSTNYIIVECLHMQIAKKM